MSSVEPAVAKARAMKPIHDVWACLDAFPDQLRLEVFNHQNDRTLIQAENPRRYPAVLISGRIGIGWIETGVESVRAAPLQIETLDGVADRVDHNLGRERKRGDYRPGR